MTILTVLSVFSGVCFLIYGISCLSSPYMAKEFERFGIPKFLKSTGILQIIGGLALLFGSWKFPHLAFTGSAGLAVLMLLGSIVRIKIKDTFLQSSPAFIFTILNTYLAYCYMDAMMFTEL